MSDVFETASSGVRLRGLVRQAVPIGLGAVCLWLVWTQLDGIDPGQVWACIVAVPPLVWAAAILATGASFWAVGQYDLVIHRHLGTGIAPDRAIATGAAAIALSQVLGMGVASGALARWRILPELSLAQAGLTSAAVAASFMLGWGAVTALALLVLPLPAGIPLWAALAGLLATGALLCAVLLAPRITLRGRIIELPSLPALARIMLYTALDTGFAALALWLLLPADPGIGFAALYPIYLIALGAALISGTPGGVGPFELTLLALLPQMPAADLLASIVAFRIVYYALPSVLAVPVLLRGLPAWTGSHARPAAAETAPGPLCLYRAPRAESGIARQGQGGAFALDANRAALLCLQTPHALVALFDPLRGRIDDALPAFRTRARASNRVAALYKASPRTALAARRFGHTTLRIASEALIDTGTYTEATPSRRQLRRKLRKARAAGLRIICAPDILPLAQMRQVADAWSAAHGGERGFSMGRFDERYVAGQKVMLAFRGETLVAFVSFHAGANEWTLDLMRHGDDMPDGTMHLLVHAGIEAARAAHCPSVSLAAVPDSPPLWRRAGLAPLFDAVAGGTGLRQFKTSFGPRWMPLYLTAPTAPALLLALADIARAVHRPGPLPPAQSLCPAHENHEDYGFARGLVS